MRHACYAALAVVLLLCGCMPATDTGTFTIVQSYRDGHPLFVLIDTRFRDVDARIGFPWFVSIATRIQHPTKDGLTNDEEASELNDWETALEKEFTAACRFVFVGRVTWNGNRELLYYVDKPDVIVPKLEKLATANPRREFRVQSARDDVWQKVFAYLKLIPDR